MTPEKADASIGQLFGSLANDTSVLVRQELQLAGAEMAAKARIAARNGGLIAAGGLVLHLSGFAAVVAMLAGLQTLIPLWAAAVVVAVLLAIVSAVMMSTGARALRELDFVPKETISTLRPDAM